MVQFGWFTLSIYKPNHKCGLNQISNITVYIELRKLTIKITSDFSVWFDLVCAVDMFTY